MNASDIFTPGTIPNETYNDRSETQLVPTLNSTLTNGGKIAILSGQTKIGKTVLVRKVIPDDKRIEIQASELEDEDVERVIAKKIGKFPIEKKVIESTLNNETDNFDLGAEGNAKAKFWGFMAKASASNRHGKGSKSETILNEIFEEDLFTRVMDYVIDNRYILVFDDFHYLRPEDQRDLIHRLKDPLSKGAKIVIVLIPNRNEDVITAEPDMQGRTRQIDVPNWSRAELRFIPESGFKKLNVILPKAIIDSIVENSFTNPYLVQDICSRVCEKLDIVNAKKAVTKVNLTMDELFEIYREMNTTDSLIDSIERGKTTKGSGRKRFTLKSSGEEVDTYVLIIMVLGKLADNNSISASNLVSGVQELVKGTSPRRSDIIATVKRMVDIARKKNERDPALAYKDEDNIIMMYDPFFSFDMRWRVPIAHDEQLTLDV